MRGRRTDFIGGGKEKGGSVEPLEGLRFAQLIAAFSVANLWLFGWGMVGYW